MAKKLKGQTLIFSNPPQIIGHTSVVGPEEKKGPYGKDFDFAYQDVKCGKDSWEKGEKQMASDALKGAMDKAGLDPSDVNLILGGDLLDEIITADYVARDQDIPFLGLYSACAIMVEALGLGAALMDGGFADCVLAFASSDYQTAERQYRNPIEYGAQYPPYKQYTVTGAAAYALGWLGGKTWITHFTAGKVLDLGVKNPNDMGSAMAPAAADTILQHFADLERGLPDYDLILSGDLGKMGKKMLLSLLQEKKLNPGKKLQDCGALIFGGKEKYGAGGSGAGASGVMLGSVFVPKIIKGEIKRILLVGTGALLSPLTIQQGESIPGIAHAVVVEKITGG